MVEGRQLISCLDLLHLEGLQAALGGIFDTHNMTWNDFLRECWHNITNLAHVVHGTNIYAPSKRIRSALTFARQAIGRSGKYMERQLEEAQDCSVAMERQESLKEETLDLYKDC